MKTNPPSNAAAAQPKAALSRVLTPELEAMTGTLHVAIRQRDEAQGKLAATHSLAGTWILQTDENDRFVEVVDSATEGRVIASFPATPEGYANARLIAAAPFQHSTILEAVEMLDGNPSPEAIDTVRAMLRAAIARATGSHRWPTEAELNAEAAALEAARATQP